MFEPTLHGIDEDSAHESGDEKSVRLSISDRVVKTHLPRGVSKPPAIIVVTQHDEVSVHKSTEDSRSETEDRDYMSECESTSFFLTEGEVDYHLLVAGMMVNTLFSSTRYKKFLKLVLACCQCADIHFWTFFGRNRFKGLSNYFNLIGHQLVSALLSLQSQFY